MSRYDLRFSKVGSRHQDNSLVSYFREDCGCVLFSLTAASRKTNQLVAL